MTQPAVLLGSLGVITENADMQRRAFNLAFQDVGLDWVWEGAGYYAMLRKPNALGRVMEYAASRGERVDGEQILARKSHHFRRLALDEGMILRPGVKEVVATARRTGAALGLVTTTPVETVDVMFDALGDALPRDQFDVIMDRSKVLVSKPSPECYTAALSELKVKARDALAIEDTPENQRAALNAGVACVAFPGLAAEGRAFDQASPVVTALTPELIPESRLSA